MNTTASRLAADAILAAHAAFVLFVIIGQVFIVLGWWRGWLWTRGFKWRVAHLLAIVFVALESWCDIACPLTVLESWLRLRTGGAPYRASFVGDWVQRLLYYSAPPWVFVAMYTGFTALVVASFILWRPRRNVGCKRRSNHAK